MVVSPDLVGMELHREIIQFRFTLNQTLIKCTLLTSDKRSVKMKNIPDFVVVYSLLFKTV